ncbi:Uncharacterised protein [Acinetobacter baumannii]|nr:Uncharacterised protein [Acinetobacter baumannii]SSU36467.1 Uncharacterised protein [Acinetobacter baumannii]
MQQLQDHPFLNQMFVCLGLHKFCHRVRKLAPLSIQQLLMHIHFFHIYDLGEGIPQFQYLLKQFQWD